MQSYIFHGIRYSIASRRHNLERRFSSSISASVLDDLDEEVDVVLLDGVAAVGDDAGLGFASWKGIEIADSELIDGSSAEIIFYGVVFYP